MQPIVTPAQMAEIDAAASDPVDELIERSGAAVAAAALDMLGGAYGRRVLVVAGPGNNGADGRSAARRLSRRGVRVTTVEPGPEAPPARPYDLVVDAAYGTGLRRDYEPPPVPDIPVLAVDIPSGIDGATGVVRGAALRATRTVALAALKPGLVMGDGRSYAGEVTVADIGLDVSGAEIHLFEDADVAAALPSRPPDAHKWRSACWVIAGSKGMSGAAHLAAGGAQRGGAGYVRLSTPGPGTDFTAPAEVVGFPLPAELWNRDVLFATNRIASLVIGPGLGRSDSNASAVRQLLPATELPAVVDGDGLAAIGTDAERIIGPRTGHTVLTPHDGEYEALTGEPPGPDRIAAATTLADVTGAHVLLKGPTTVVADPLGSVVVVTSGDQRLATAGTGDVLAGLIGAFLARGADPLMAAAAAAHVHGRAASRYEAGLVAGDLLDEIPIVLGRLGRPSR